MRSMTADPSVKSQKLKPGTLARIISYAKPYKSQIALFLVTVVIDAILIISTPLILRKLIDDAVIPKNAALVTQLALAVAGIAVLDALFNVIGRWFSARIGEGLIFDLRTQLFSHVQSQSVAFFTRTQTGSLISRLNSDVMGAQQAFTSTLSSVVSNTFTLILVAGTMFFLSWQITMLSLILLPLFIYPTKWVGRKIQQLTRQSFDLNAKMSSTMTERFNVSGAILVSLYGNPASESKLFSERARKVADIGIHMGMLNRLFFTSLTSVAAVATAFAYGFGGHMAINGSISVGTLLALTALLARLYGPLTALSNVRVEVMTSLVSFERIFEVLDLHPMVKDLPSARELTSEPITLEVRDLHFSYPKAEEISLASLESVAKQEIVETGEILKGISFTAQAGTLTAIVGPSGAGKTTLSALIPRLYDATQGSILFNGRDVREFTLQSLRDRIGVVAQDPHLFHETIAENLRYAKSEASDVELIEACKAAQIWSLIESLPNGLDTMVGERGHRLSGGEKQRLAIARMLLKSPSIVILDEATAHLDSENEELVQAALKSALQGRTSLVIAHRLSTVMDADQIIVIDDGRIVESGKHSELMKSGGLYSELFSRQDLTANQDSTVDH